MSRCWRRFALPAAHWRLPRCTGVIASSLFLLAALGYAVVKGEHIPTIVAALKNTADAGANALGMRIAAVSLSGQRQVSREEIFVAAGVTASSSLLFLDVAEARAKLEAIPWIAEATVRKLYPDRLQITITEREAFALWQLQGRISVVAADGTILSTAVEPRHTTLPFVVGPGAAKQARSFLAILDKHPAIRDQMRAAILVGERRWNLRLKNGIDVRLPESDIESALTRLAQLDHDRKLLTRDIAAVDLRLTDRIAVRLSDAAAQAREDALKKTSKKKGGDA